jgi:hypothetical protein
MILLADEHDPIRNPGAKPSSCLLSAFHGPAKPGDAPASGHVSHDGHAYSCKDPTTMGESFHVFFAIDKSVYNFF